MNRRQNLMVLSTLNDTLVFLLYLRISYKFIVFFFKFKSSFHILSFPHDSKVLEIIRKTIIVINYFRENLEKTNKNPENQLNHFPFLETAVLKTRFEL